MNMASTRDFLMACGYSQSGKDTLSRKINGCSLTTDIYDWVILGPRSDSHLDLSGPRTRIAFADEVKAQCVNMIINYDQNDEQLIKLQALYRQNPDVEQLKLIPEFRKFLIAHATAERAIDPDIWVRTALSNIPDSFNNKYINTDFRFPNEPEFIRSTGATVTTVRVVAINPEVIRHETESEIGLDSYLTDFVMVRSSQITDRDGIFKRLITMFPQYADYMFLS